LSRRKLRMGMVGGGQGSFIGAVHRLAVNLDGQADLVAGVFSRDPENSRTTGQQLGLDPARVYRSFDEMAAAEAALPPDRRIDFVSIVTPNHVHFAPARAFLEAGIHVVCDKPLALTVDEAEALVQIVERTGLVFALTHNYAGYPLIRHARELFQTGALGTVRKVIVEYLQGWLVEPLEQRGSKQATWRTNPAESGAGGAVGDIGTHALHLFEYVTGDRVVELCADKATFLPGRTLDEDMNVLLRLRGGGKGVLTISQIAIGEENGLRLRVYGSSGAVLWAQEDPNYLSVYRHGEPRQILSRGRSEYLSAAAMQATRIPWGHPEGYLEAFANIYHDAIDAIWQHHEGRSEASGVGFATVRDGLRGMQFVQKSVESASAGGVWIAM
jgi:predicted dehydrogenase